MNAADASSSSTGQAAGGTAADLSPAFVPLADAARYLSIGVSTAYDLHARGEFPVPVVRIGRSLRVSVAALHNFAASAA